MRMRHIVVCGVSRSTILFPHYLIKDRIFEKKNITEHKMCVLIFSTSFVWNISHSKKNWARYDKKCILVFMQGSRYSCQILTKLEFSRQIFEKYSNTKSHENPSSGKRVVTCGQTDGKGDRHDEANIRFFRSFANAPPPPKKNYTDLHYKTRCRLSWHTDVLSSSRSREKVPIFLLHVRLSFLM